MFVAVLDYVLPRQAQRREPTPHSHDVESPSLLQGRGLSHRKRRAHFSRRIRLKPTIPADSAAGFFEGVAEFYVFFFFSISPHRLDVDRQKIDAADVLVAVLMVSW